MCGNYTETTGSYEGEARKKGRFLVFWTLYLAGTAALVGWIIFHLRLYEWHFPTFP